MMNVASILRREVEHSGVISLARFMELALYCPEFGYYERRGGSDSAAHGLPIGREGDYYTSVSTGKLFGELLAFQFAQWLEELADQEVSDPEGHHRPADRLPCCSARCQLVEVGAHDGGLALDILGWLKLHRPKLLSGLEYWLIEPSEQRQSWQRTTLESFAGQVRWANSLPSPSSAGKVRGRHSGGSTFTARRQTLSIPVTQVATANQATGSVCGIIFCNELLDSFPAHRLAWDRASGKWMEWGVGLSNDQFVWRPLRRAERDWNAELSQAGFDLSPELLGVLPDGFIIDHCPEAQAWWQEAAAALRQGRLLTIDYGFTSPQFFSPERSQGTLRAYRRQRLIGDVLANPGEQDLTTHVNFTQIQKAGEAEGLQTEGFLTQTQFLTAIATKLWTESSASPSPGQVRQFQTLTHPEHLGRPFRVLIQSRNG
jgi:SAM-dependent MidA family methyltransferase